MSDIDPVTYNTLISPKRAHEITSLSTRELSRREDVGEFPRSVKIGHGPNGRKAYVLGEVIEWTKALIAEHHAAHENKREFGRAIERAAAKANGAKS